MSHSFKLNQGRNDSLLSIVFNNCKWCLFHVVGVEKVQLFRIRNITIEDFGIAVTELMLFISIEVYVIHRSGRNCQTYTLRCL